jgi:hypothetical protein
MANYDTLLDTLNSQQWESYRGDNRDNAHKGYLSADPRAIAYMLLVEGWIVHRREIPLVVKGVLCRAITERLERLFSSARQGKSFGIRANLTRQVVVRAFHCKFDVKVRYLGCRNGIYGFSLMRYKAQGYDGSVESRPDTMLLAISSTGELVAHKGVV